jgi:hypothetical protein
MIVSRERGDDRGRASFVTVDVPDAGTLLIEDENVIDFDLTAFYLQHSSRAPLFLFDAKCIDAVLFALWISSQQEQRDLSSLVPRSSSFPLVHHYRALLPTLKHKIGADPLFGEMLLLPHNAEYKDLDSLAFCCAKVHLNFFKYVNNADRHDHLILSALSSSLNHDCEPNAMSRTVIRGLRSETSMRVVKLSSVIETLRPPNTGEEVTISCLTPQQLMMSLKERQREFVRGRGFVVHAVVVKGSARRSLEYINSSVSAPPAITETSNSSPPCSHLRGGGCQSGGELTIPKLASARG